MTNFFHTLNHQKTIYFTAQNCWLWNSISKLSDNNSYYRHIRIHSFYECIILNDDNASNQNGSEMKMLDKMKQPLEILIKLKLIFTSYAELFNGSITEKVMLSFSSPQKKESAQIFLHNAYDRFMRNPDHPCIFAYFVLRLSALTA